VWWFSPHVFLSVLFLSFVDFVVGENNRRGDIYYSRSPLCVFCFVYMSTFYIQDVGEIHRREEVFITLVLPSVIFDL